MCDVELMYLVMNFVPSGNMVGQRARQQQTDGGLNFPGSQRRSAVHLDQSGHFGCNPLEYAVDETVHDAH